MRHYYYLILLLAFGSFDFVYSLRQNKKFSLLSDLKALRKDIKVIFLLGVLSIESSAEIFARLPQKIIYGSTPTVIQRNDVTKDNLGKISTNLVN
jgi:hypothetical protein